VEPIEPAEQAPETAPEPAPAEQAPAGQAAVAAKPKDKESTQKTFVGRVVSNKMNKTVVVSVDKLKRHRLYHRNLRRAVKYKAHDEQNACGMGDVVRIVETRPLSKDKHWRVVEILKRGDEIGAI
jgi:small subunit ribosomal protein S17